MRISTKHIGHGRGHSGYSYPVSLSQRLYTLLLAPLALIVIIFVFLQLTHLFPTQLSSSVSFGELVRAAGATLSRLLIAYGCALVASVPLALAINRNPLTERLLLPVFDILQSVPVLAFFPVIIVVFIRYNFYSGAAVFIIFLSMLWNLVFNIVGGLNVIPTDIIDAAHIFRIRGWKLVRQVILPASFPSIVTGSILAWAQGWNIIIVAEVLHTYIPGGTTKQDLFGLGSELVHASATGQNGLFIACIALLVTIIGLINLFIWQRLLHRAERYKFE